MDGLTASTTHTTRLDVRGPAVFQWRTESGRELFVREVVACWEREYDTGRDTWVPRFVSVEVRGPAHLKTETVGSRWFTAHDVVFGLLPEHVRIALLLAAHTDDRVVASR